MSHMSYSSHVVTWRVMGHVGTRCEGLHLACGLCGIRVACVAKVECLLAAAGKGLILSVATPGQGGQQCQQCGSDIVHHCSKFLGKWSVRHTLAT